ncbi:MULTISPECIES: hypothetical protein [Polyangium]|uniref:Uncharacterized protein n=2 Tax=Polyangium TaxID=55 RepID=A0A4U1ID46_9BACT|nr:MULTISPECIES: hypothetical protein [Polyangium]MDI1433634.1 hypothetical protein [Polyangium sorediatum]TKC91467.1 hypothetical protein E8A74_50695 [Polyangium fumosum]
MKKSSPSPCRRSPVYAVFVLLALSAAGACGGQAQAPGDQAPAQPSSDPQPTRTPEPEPTPTAATQPTSTAGDQQAPPTGTADPLPPATSECDPAKEPHRRYLGDRNKCMLIKYRCDPPQTSFHNACGCGCE